jgi:predicted regulator of Ras-like GTPase activity (Roadblock/LC7/MglB family)
LKTERVQAGASIAVFRDNIQKLVDRLEGGVGGVLMAFDGITVDSYVRDGVATAVADIQTIGLELAHFIGQARRTAQSLDFGSLRELTFRTDKLTVLMHVLNKEYFVACAFRADPASAKDDGAADDRANSGGGRLGRARYLMRLAIPEIEAQL